MQDHLGVAAVPSGVNQSVQNALAQGAAAHLLFDRHAPNSGHTGRVLNQAACRQAHPHAVQCHGVQGCGVRLIPLQFCGDLLLMHKYLGPQRAGLFLEVMP